MRLWNDIKYCTRDVCTVYRVNENCLVGDVLRQRLHSVCNASLVNSSTEGSSDTTTVNDQCRSGNTTTLRRRPVHVFSTEWRQERHPGHKKLHRLPLMECTFQFTSSFSAIPSPIGVIYGGTRGTGTPTFWIEGTVPLTFQDKKWRICCHLFRPGLRQDPAGISHDALLDPRVGWGGGYFLTILHPFRLGTQGHLVLLLNWYFTC